MLSLSTVCISARRNFYGELARSTKVGLGRRSKRCVSGGEPRDVGVFNFDKVDRKFAILEEFRRIL